MACSVGRPLFSGTVCPSCSPLRGSHYMGLVAVSCVILLPRTDLHNWHIRLRREENPDRYSSHLSLTHSLSLSLTQSLTHPLSLSYPLTPLTTLSLTHLPTHSPTHSLSHSFTHLPTHPLTTYMYTLTHSLTQLPTHHQHVYTHSLTHPLTHPPLHTNVNTLRNRLVT